MHDTVQRAVRQAERDLKRQNERGPSLLEDPMFDVSHAYDGTFEGEVDNPFHGMSKAPDVMIAFQRPDMEQRLRVCIQQANRAHWALPSDYYGEKARIDPLALREPNPAEAKSLKLAPEADKFAREAAHIRAYLAQLDAKAAKARAEELERKRNALQHRAATATAEQTRWADMIEANKAAVDRHEQRLRDEEAHKLVALARTELAALERKAEDAKRELDAIRPPST